MKMTAQDHALFKAKIAQLGAPLNVSSRGISIPAKDQIARLNAIVSHIDNSLLAETLVFEAGSIHLSLAVRGRRLLGITDAQGLTIGDDLIGARVSPEDDDLMTAMQTAITTLTNSDAALHLKVAPTTDLGLGATIGLSVAQLRQAWGLTAHDIDLSGDTPLHTLALNLKEATTATLWAKGTTAGDHAGSKDHIDALTTILSTQVPAILATYDDPAAASLSCLSGAGPDGTTILVALHNTQILLLMTTPQAAQKAHHIWCQISAR